MKVFDILLDAFFDLQIKNGDFVVGESTAQHQKLLLVAEPGEFKQHPTATVGLSGFINEDNPGAMKSTIIRKFELDGMRVDRVKFDGAEKVNIQSEYE